MKRTPLARKTPLKRSSRLTSHTPVKKKAPIRNVNRARMTRKLAAQRAFYASAQWEALKLATFARDAWTCQMPGCGFTPMVVGTQQIRDVLDSRYLVCHHVKKTRFGGKERPSDLITWCNQCHDRHHASELLQPRHRRAG